MKQQMVAIEYNSVTEMKAIRSVLASLGYPIWESFKHDNTMGGFRYVRIDRSDVHRGTLAPTYTKLTLQQFIDREEALTKSGRGDTIARIEGMEHSIGELTRQLAELKASI